MNDILFASAIPAIDATPFVALDNMGNRLVFTVPHPRGGAMITQVTITDAAAQRAPMDLLLFRSVISAGSTIVNKLAVVLTAADLANCFAYIPFVAADYCVAFSTNRAVATKTLAQPIAFCLDTPPNLYGVLISRGTPTYAGTDLRVVLGGTIL